MRGPAARRPRTIAVIAATALAVLTLLTARPGSASAATPIQVYGTWLCGTDECTWATAPDMTAFDSGNHWLIDRGDGTPSVNLVVLAFVNPLKLLNQTTDAGDVNGVPAGLTSAVVNYFTSHGVRVMLSIGGVTYTGDWDTALSQNPSQFGRNAATIAKQLGVGIEIDYENGTNPNLAGLQSFITAYRAQQPTMPPAPIPPRGSPSTWPAGDQYLTDLARYATQNWLTASNPVLDYANAMVANKQLSTSKQEEQWQEHISGEPQYGPPVPPLAPAKFTGSVYIAGTSQVPPECDNFSASLESSTGSFVRNAAPSGAGTTPGMLGYMFWAAGQPSAHGTTTFPPSTCQGGVGTGSSTYSVPVPMPALRQG